LKDFLVKHAFLAAISGTTMRIPHRVFLRKNDRFHDSVKRFIRAIERTGKFLVLQGCETMGHERLVIGGNSGLNFCDPDPLRLVSQYLHHDEAAETTPFSPPELEYTIRDCRKPIDS